jgi:16S rRNA (cytidine1402-2'-O)-methyltransferase
MTPPTEAPNPGAAISYRRSPTVGTLSLVATPLGNLEDITLRALRVLREADLVLAEDTRRTRVLLEHHHVATRALESLHEHNERERTARLLRRLDEGQHLALVSDAGTPLVSDPGEGLVREAIEAGHRVDPIPGPSAVIAALIASGLSAESFCFRGFLPRKGERKKLLASLVEETPTQIFYESPRRLRESLEEVRELFGERRLCVARELTKIHQEFLRGTAADVLAALPEEVLGEITLLLAGAPVVEAAPPDEEVLARVLRVALRAGASVKNAAAAAADELGIPKKNAYQMALSLRASLPGGDQGEDS